MSEAGIGAYDTSWDIDDGLAFFSKKLAEQDFKTDGTDAAGKSWNGDPKDPADYSKQLVQTFTVGFGQGISPSGKRYLQLAASHPEYYYEADKPESLSKVFNDIVEQIKSGTKMWVTTMLVRPRLQRPAAACLRCRQLSV